jgi:hypothetical protein
LAVAAIGYGVSSGALCVSPTACLGHDTPNRKQKRQKHPTNPAARYILLHEIVIDQPKTIEFILK